MERFAGKTCLVTAAGQGIGAAIARRLAAEGGAVLATDIDDKALKTLAADTGAQSGCKTARLDVLDRTAISEIVGDGGPFDVVVNCAGFVHNGTILDCGEKDWAFSLDLNLGSMYRVLRAALPAMLENGGGAIVNISSVASSVAGVANRFVYGTSKAGVIGLTKSVARDFVSRNIRCNAICPGTVDSPSLKVRLTATGDYEAARKAFAERQPMGRIGTPEEIAALAAYLASDEAGYTTGQAYNADGGWTI